MMKTEVCSIGVVERTGLAVAVFSGVDAARRVGGTAFHESSIVKQRVVTGAVRWQTQK